ncbi:GNAT family N-acetyltransferase [Pseudonocardia broussonetiae]|uniref:N-acetyltransferase n=1 Tax=Pseudonocardia broussonetiae TaxID=2736640 RepID=A0A6M6JP41_9PSEU|nr:GNAT family N-acetyltransferase [Pseudonocardia broussonetiae]QJY48352.1 N-acetyltransferase [Pseudonocardia broussonetiae]
MADAAPAPAEPTVLDVAEWSRFEIHTGGKLAGFAAYRTRPGVITFTHTEIDTAFEGQGLGGRLVRAALDAARARGLAVHPACPFVRSWIAKHPEYADLVPSEEHARYGLA